DGRLTESFMDKHVIILGAGPAGLTAAYELCKRGVAVTVLEADNIVGGIARTEAYKGYHYDIGGHRFYTKMSEVNRIWHEMMGDEFIEVPRLSRIRYYDKYFYYPLRPLNAFFGLGLKNSIWVTLSYIHSRLFPMLPEESFEDYVSNRFGKRLFYIFFKVYTEKVWGIPCSEIRAEWAAQRIRGLSFTSAVTNALLKSHNGSIKSLIEKFEYPRLGPGEMWNKFKAWVEARGARVQLNSPVVRVQREGTRIVQVTAMRDGRAETITGTHFISTLALRDLIQRLDPPAPDDVRHAADGLRYRDFLTVLVVINRAAMFPDNWIYIHTPHVHVGRIQNFKNWSKDMVPDPNMTSLGLEYFVSEGDALWAMADADLIELAKKELLFLKLAEPHEIVDGTVTRMKKAYPVYDSTYRDNLAIVRGYLDAFENFQTVGRNGLHKYNNQDHSMMTALLAARNICGERHDIWAVNTDLEYQEEIRLDDKAADGG
ncbi:MAG: NAD(P)/FAD-dependent oxidoreductase, partial [Chloroflexota bacterium]